MSQSPLQNIFETCTWLLSFRSHPWRTGGNDKVLNQSSLLQKKGSCREDVYRTRRTADAKGAEGTSNTSKGVSERSGGGGGGGREKEGADLEASGG